jgi:glycosyltransferase involved in cell wall biosynthesis
MIGIISRTEGNGSGAEIMLCHLLDNWKYDYPLLIITAVGSSVAKAAKLNRIQLLELSFTAEKYLVNIKAVEYSLKRLRAVTLVHAWNSKSFELGWYISKRLGVSMTCTMHDHPCSNYYTLKKLWLLKTIANNSKSLVAVSEVLAKECKQNGYRVPITTIRNGLPVPFNLKANNEAGDKVIVGFLGMSSEGKGFSIVSDWIKKTAENSKVEWRLYGNVCTRYEEIISQLKGDGFRNFVLCGRQAPEEIFKQIHILVHASTMFDCYPTVLLEAARAGVPAISSSRGGAAEIVEHGKTGFLFDPVTPKEGLNHLKVLLEDKPLFNQLSDNSRQRFSERLQITGMVNSYYHLWMKLLPVSG